MKIQNYRLSFKFSLIKVVPAVCLIIFNPTSTFAQSCSAIRTNLQSIQAQQYNLKAGSGQNTQRLLDLEREHDHILSQVAIIRELHQLNDSFFRALRETTVPISEGGFTEVMSALDQISTESLEGDRSRNHLTALENMSTMDALLTEMKQANSIDINRFRVTEADLDGKSYEDAVADKVESLISACQSTASPSNLCRSLNASVEKEQLILEGKTIEDNKKANKTRNLISGFLHAYSADQSNTSNRAQLLQNYQDVLRNGLPEDVDLTALTESFRGVVANSRSSQIVARIRNYASDPSDRTRLNFAYCCTLSTVQSNQRDACKEDTGFERRLCRQYANEAGNSFTRLFQTFNNYETRVYETLDFNFDNTAVAENELSPLMDTRIAEAFETVNNDNDVLKSYVDAISNPLRILGSRSAESGVSRSLENLNISVDQMNQSVNNIALRLGTIFKRGKVLLPENHNIRSSEFSMNTVADGINLNTLPEVVSRLNEAICSLAKGIKPNQTIDCDVFVSIAQDGEGIVVNNASQLMGIFGSGEDVHQFWQSQTSKFNKDLGDKRAEIARIKSGPEYSHLNQIKNFMVWDYRTRCSSENSIVVSVPNCNSDIDPSPGVEYLVDDVNNVTQALFAEYDPSSINLGNASLQERRLILGNMSGACQGLTRLNTERPNDGFNANGIEQACQSITSMNTTASTVTAHERGSRIRSRGYRLNSDGDYERRRSTGSMIGAGILRGLGNSAPLLAGTYFQGRMVTDNIPYQERAIYNQLEQQYAYQWYSENAPFNYFGTPGFNNPYYLPQFTGYSAGYNFNTSGI